MRRAVWPMWPLLFLAFTVVLAEYEEEWIDEEENSDGSYYSEPEEVYHERRRRQVYEEEASDCDCEHRRVKRSNRPIRQVHQYEVHEFTEDAEPASKPYEQMLAASAEHYHRVYHTPGAPSAARYISPVSHVPTGFAYHPVNFVQSPSKFEVLSVPNFVSVANSPAAVPLPLASEPLIQPLQQLSDNGDLYAAGAHHHKTHKHGHSQGGGHEHAGNHYAGKGGKSSRGYNSDHYVDKGGKGYKLDEKHRKEYEEAGGKKKKHHDIADHRGSHEEEAHGARGSHFDAKKGHKKGHKTKGYHNKYHKDEFHKEHKFYDDYHKSGEHHRYGKFNAKHASNESGKKKAHHVKAGHDFMETGKKGYSNKGHVDADHKGYDDHGGHEEHHEHHHDHGKKGGKEGGSQWGYQKKI